MLSVYRKLKTVISFCFLELRRFINSDNDLFNCSWKGRHNFTFFANNYSNFLMIPSSRTCPLTGVKRSSTQVILRIQVSSWQKYIWYRNLSRIILRDRRNFVKSWLYDRSKIVFNIWFSDECSFFNGSENHHNCHYWFSNSNPTRFYRVHMEHQLKIEY